MVRQKKAQDIAARVQTDPQAIRELDEKLGLLETAHVGAFVEPLSKRQIITPSDHEALGPLLKPLGEVRGPVSGHPARTLKYAKGFMLEQAKRSFAIPKNIAGYQPSEAELTGGELLGKTLSGLEEQGKVVQRRDRLTGYFLNEGGQTTRVETETPKWIRNGLGPAVSALAEERIERDRDQRTLFSHTSPLERELGKNPLKDIVEGLVLNEMDENPGLKSMVGRTLKSMHDSNVSLNEGNFKKVWAQMRAVGDQKA